jgi:hypothetical protein
MRYTWRETNHLIAVGIASAGWVMAHRLAHEPAFPIGHNRNATNAKGSPHTTKHGISNRRRHGFPRIRPFPIHSVSTRRAELWPSSAVSLGHARDTKPLLQFVDILRAAEWGAGFR